MNIYQEENDLLAWNFLERNFFSNFRLPLSKLIDKKCHRLHLILNTVCNQSCSYCYYARYGKDLIPDYASKPQSILNNLQILLDYLVTENMHPILEIFSGDLFSQKLGFDALDLILDYCRQYKITHHIFIANNGTFILYKDITERIINYIDEFSKIGVELKLSMSVDGKYMEGNRIITKGKGFTDADYENLFSFCKKHDFGFHPLIYSNNIEKWEDNLSWFIYNFKKHNLSWNKLQALEVMNQEWTLDQTKTYLDFVEFTMKLMYDYLGKDPYKILEFICKDGFNFLSIVQGIPENFVCMLPRRLSVRLGDLAVFNCPRLSYDIFKFGNFKVERDRIIGFSSKNIQFFMAVFSANRTSLPICESCKIRNFCPGQCLGSMYETTGDPFSPIPTVCRLFHGKVKTIFRILKEIGCFQLSDFQQLAIKNNTYTILKNIGVS